VLTPGQASSFRSWHDINFSTITSTINLPEADCSFIVTRGVAASIARDAVFNTNELLETILQDLSIEDLLTARHINQYWRLLIDQSPRLQRSLFLLQERQYHLWVFDRLTQALREYKIGDSERYGLAWTQRQNIAIPSIINPFLFKQNGTGIKGTLTHRAKFCESMTLKAPPSLKKPNSLINKMFLSLPAPRNVEYCFYYHRSKPRGRGKFYGDGCIRGTVENPCGVTLGEVLEAFLQVAKPKVAQRLGVVEDVVEDYVICKNSSVVWLSGQVFPTKGEFEEIKADST
jgi:hypothetical protein